MLQINKLHCQKNKWKDKVFMPTISGIEHFKIINVVSGMPIFKNSTKGGGGGLTSLVIKLAPNNPHIVNQTKDNTSYVFDFS